MTNDDELAVRQLPDAFDRLTSALHGNAKRRRLAGVAVAAIIAAVGVNQWAIQNVAGETRRQSFKNQEHIDCIIAVLARQDPPKCRPVRAQLVADGIIPAVLPGPTPSSTPTG